MSINMRSHNTWRSPFGLPVHSFNIYLIIVFVTEINFMGYILQLAYPITLHYTNTYARTFNITKVWLNFVTTCSFGVIQNGKSTPSWNTIRCSSSTSRICSCGPRQPTSCLIFVGCIYCCVLKYRLFIFITFNLYYNDLPLPQGWSNRNIKSIPGLRALRILVKSSICRTTRL